MSATMRMQTISAIARVSVFAVFGCGDDGSGGSGDSGGSTTGVAGTTMDAGDATGLDSTGVATTEPGSGSSGPPEPTTSGATSTDTGPTDSSGESTGAMAVCGDGLVEGTEVCDGQPQCLDDCTYPPNTIFWEAIVDGVTASDSACGWGVGFDSLDRPVYGGRQFGTGGDPFAALREPDGTLVWSQRYPSMPSTANFAYGLTVTSDDVVVLPGQVSTFTADGNDVYDSSLSIDGMPGWEHHASDSANEWHVAAAPYGDGSVAIVGARNQDLVLDDRALLVRLDATGVPQWSVEHMGPMGTENAFTDVVVDDTDAAIVLGCCDDVTGQTMLAAYDDAGLPLWQTPLGPVDTGAFFGGGLARDPDGRFVAVAEDDTGGAWIARVDADGTLLWDHAIAGAQDVWPTGVAATPQGTYVVAGQSYDPIAGAGYLWYGVLDSSGALQYSDTVAGAGGGTFARADAIVVDSHGLALVGGELTAGPGPAPPLKGFVRMFAP